MYSILIFIRKKKGWAPQYITIAYDNNFSACFSIA